MQKSKIVSYIDKLITWLYYLLFFFTPLAMASFTSELFEFNKMMFIYTVTVAIAFFWLLKMIIYRKIILKKTILDIPIYLFLGSQLLSTLFSIDIHTSIFGYYGRFNGGLLSTITYIILFYAFVSNLPIGRQTIEKLLKVSLISSTAVMLWGLPGRFGHDLSCLLFMGQFNNSCWTDQFRPAERMFSTLGQPNWLGALLAINFFIGMYFFVKEILIPNGSGQDDKKIIMYGIYLFANFTFVLFTRSRSALGAVAIGFISFTIYLLFSYKFEFRKLIDKKAGLLLVSLIFSVVIFKTGIQKIDQFYDLNYYKSLFIKTKQIKPNQTQPKAQTTVTFETDVTASSDIRRIVWKGAIDLGLKYPIFGTGVETFAYSYYFVRPKEHNLTSEWDFLYNKAHNEFLNYFATTGFLGIGTYMLLIGAVFFVIARSITTKQSQSKEIATLTSFARNDTLLIICLTLSYLTILITNFFGFSTTTINLFFFLIPGFIIILKSKENFVVETPENYRLTVNQWILSSVVFIVAVLLFIYLARYYLADYYYAKGDNYSKIGDYQKSAQALESAYNLRYEHVYEDKLSYVLANIAFIASYQKQTDLAKRMVLTADALNKKSLTASPKNVLYWKTRAKNFYLFYQINLDKKDLISGIQALGEAEKLAPTDPKIPYSLAIFYSLLEDDTKNQSEKSQYEAFYLSEINKAIDLKPDYRDGYFLKGQLLKKIGQREEAKKVFQFILDKFNSNDQDVKKELTTL